MATFIERVMHISDWDTDGGDIYVPFIASYFDLYSSEMVTASSIKSAFNMTTAQGNQLDSILATRPGIVLLDLTLANVANRCRWASRITGVLNLAQAGFPGYTSATAVATALGI